MPDTPTYLLPEKDGADVLAAVWWSRHTHREKSVVGYMCTQHRDTYIQYNSSWWNWGKSRSLLVLLI